MFQVGVQVQEHKVNFFWRQNEKERETERGRERETQRETQRKRE
jgi:hypothetical protein